MRWNIPLMYNKIAMMLGVHDRSYIIITKIILSENNPNNTIRLAKERTEN
jgi:hypothetical protein